MKVRIGWGAFAIGLAALGLWLGLGAKDWVSAAGERSPRLLLGLVDLDALSAAITEMDVERARELSDRYQHRTLTTGQSHRLAVERTRLALYMGDCDGAEAIASGLDVDNRQVASLLSVATRCAGAVAGSRIVEDPERGLWIRLQDVADLPLVPFLSRVAVLAREAVKRDLGVELPRPLRIDLVRDLFSLSAVSGLPLEAAETTGTVAVARWGRVTLLSPRAAAHGYPWEDTLAHELVHLGLSRATRDYAPLWLQEGVAKRQELRWRPVRPFDEKTAHDRVARNALLTGTSVGVDKLGPSIAMLPTANAASIAFAEVTSFIDYWIAENGRGAFRLLLADLRGLADRNPSSALLSGTGYSLEAWIARWQQFLRQLPAVSLDPLRTPAERDEHVARRHRRLGDLLIGRHHFVTAARHYEDGLKAASGVPELMVGAALANLGAGNVERARLALGSLKALPRRSAGWFALRSRLDPKAGAQGGWVNDAEIAISLDPFSELAACKGYTGDIVGSSPTSPHLKRSEPTSEDAHWRALCEGARARARIQ